MKKILITGENSYIGNATDKWLKDASQDYHIDKVSMRDDKWRAIDLGEYDSILHVAGIAHVSSNPKMKEKYYRVNRDLTIELAKKAKADGARQFIFLSSIIIFGSGNEMIDEKTKPNPDNFYGNSKLEAEEGIIPLQDTTFNVAIIRPPMIYGKGSKGNYSKLAKLARITPIFPNFNNLRSILHIDNLTEFIRLLIMNCDKGIFHPQNEEYANIAKLVEKIGKHHNHRLVLTDYFNPIIKIKQNNMIIKKVFGTLIYDHSLSKYKDDFVIRDLNESIKLTED